MPETGALDRRGLSLDSIAVVGASTAGLAAAGALRHLGFTGRLTLIGDEPHRPYDRPPLSKQYLAGEWDSGRLALPGADSPDLDAEWLLGSPAENLDVATKTIRCADGSTVTADGVVLACGARPRPLPGADGFDVVFMLRTLDDSTRLRELFATSPGRVVVVGAGFIGAEVAATARGLGLEVTLVEPLDAPLARVLGGEVGGAFAELHRDHGVDVRLGVGVDHVVANGSGRASGVILTDGTSVDTSAVVVGIGVTPNTEWLDDSGLRIDDGVVCDSSCTAAPGIVAAGDIARWPNPTFDGALMRIEHWDHAFAQAEHAAASLLAGEEAAPFATVPWFWSDQYDRKVQLAGRVAGADETRLVEGSFDERRFVVLYGRMGRLVGVLGMNRPRHVVMLRPRIAEHISLDEAAATFS